MVVKECVNCHELKQHHAKSLCYACYKKVKWKPAIHNCKRCKRSRTMHAKGFCASCYNYLFHADKAKAHYHSKTTGIEVKTYRKTTKECAVCGFDKIVDLFHLDRNKQNSKSENLVGLCPNHARMAKNHRFRHEVYLTLSKKGFQVPLSYLEDK